jgi:alcohol dehydrogenase class IV
LRYKAASGEAAAPGAGGWALSLPDVSNLDAALTLADAVAGLVQRLELPARLQDVNVPQEAFEGIAQAAAEDPQQANDILEILHQAW